MAEAICTSDAPAPVGPYSQAVRIGNNVYCSGQIGLDPQTGSMVGSPDDLEAETRQVLHNLRAVLKAAGATPAHVVRTTIYLTDLKHFVLVNELYGEMFNTGVLPARACIEAAALPKGAHVEVDAIAVLDEPEPLEQVR